MMEATNCKIKIVAILTISMLGFTASSWGQVAICEPCHTEKLRRAAMDKAFASIGCESYDCGKMLKFLCNDQVESVH
jgi:hypothetical protein